MEEYMMKITSLLLLLVSSVFCCAHDIQEDDFNNLMICDEQALADRVDQFILYSRFAKLVEAINSKNEKTAIKLILTMTQEELNVQDYVGRTPLRIAIEKGQEDIAYLLARVMNKEGLELRDMEGVTALDDAYRQGISKVSDAICNTIDREQSQLLKIHPMAKDHVNIMGVWTLKNVVSYSQIILWKLCKQAIKYNQTSVFKMLFKRMWVPILIHCEDDHDGFILLEYALRLGRMEIIEILNQRYSQIKW